MTTTALSACTDREGNEATRVKSAQPVKGLGSAAVYFPDGGQLDVGVKGAKYSFYSSGRHNTKTRIIALARVLVPSR